MNFTNINSITIQFEDLQDLRGGVTGNPIAEALVPEYLKLALRSGVQVFVSDETGAPRWRLRDDEGILSIGPLRPESGPD